MVLRQIINMQAIHSLGLSHSILYKKYIKIIFNRILMLHKKCHQLIKFYCYVLTIIKILHAIMKIEDTACHNKDLTQPNKYLF